MIRLVPTRNPVDPANEGSGLLPRLRAWFARSATSSVVACEPPSVIINDAGSCGAPHGSTQRSARTAVLLPFPIHGEALLVKLATQLQLRIADLAPPYNLFFLTMSRIPETRLLIDRASYIEFRAEKSTYHVVIEAAPDTTVTLATTDFDTVVQFVVQYANGRLSEATAFEVAS